MIKNLVIPAVVGIAALVLSHKIVYINQKSDGKMDLVGIAKQVENGPLAIICMNIRFIPLIVVDKKMISLKKGQSLFHLCSGVHGLCAAAICRYGLNRFFPG
jgi:hypothetical protein